MLLSCSLLRHFIDFASYLSLLVDFAKQRLVQLELLLRHFALCVFRLFLAHLLVQESCVLLVDFLNLLSQSFLFELVVLFVTRPDHCLLVNVPLHPLLASLLFVHLLRQQRAHLCLFNCLSFSLLLLHHAQTHLALHCVTLHIVVLVSLLISLVLNHSTCHSVHKLLGTAFASLEFLCAVLLLLFDDPCVFLLRLNILSTFIKLIGFLLALVVLVLNKHLLEIVSLLVALF